MFNVILLGQSTIGENCSCFSVEMKIGQNPGTNSQSYDRYNNRHDQK